MTTFQWGKVEKVTDSEGKFRIDGPEIQVVICLDCFAWHHDSPRECRLWMIDHSEEHNRGKNIYSRKESMDVYGPDAYDDKRYD